MNMLSDIITAPYLPQHHYLWPQDHHHLKAYHIWPPSLTVSAIIASLVNSIGIITTYRCMSGPSMGENQKMSDDNINLSQVEQDMCPAQPCCTLVSYSFFLYHIHFAPSYKTCIHCKNMCACSKWNPTHNSRQSIFGVGSRSCIGRLLLGRKSRSSYFP